MRRVRFVIACFVGGIALNYLIAWGCIMWTPSRGATLPPIDDGQDGYPPFVEGPEGEPTGWWRYSWGFGWWEACRVGLHTHMDKFSHWKYTYAPMYRRAGWPFLLVQSLVRYVDDGTGDTSKWPRRWDLPRDEIMRRGLNTSDLPSWLGAQWDSRLPLVPLWPAFLVNTILYTLIIATHWRAVRWAIGHRRAQERAATTCL